MKSSIRPLAIIVVSTFGFLLIVSFYADKNQFELTAKEVHDRVLITDYQLDSTAFVQLTDPYLIDIRDEHHYQIGHVDGAMNIPLSRILEEHYDELFQADRPKVILAHDPVKGHEAWMLLTQLGYSQLFLLKLKEPTLEPLILHVGSGESIGGH